jgi:hypothetical protein
MVSKIETYLEVLTHLQDWDAYLLAESNLPGPRANLELLHAAADLGSAALFKRYLSFTPDLALENTPQVFLAACGVVGLGRLLAEGDLTWLPALRALASDPRWRIREAVCMALQRLGKQDMTILLQKMKAWASGNPFEQRAAVAALCEPALLVEEKDALAVLNILDQITRAILSVTDRKAEDFRVLRKGLAYCWSVAVAALPEPGKQVFEKWVSQPDSDICWIIKQNLGKKRLLKLDPHWVERCLRLLEPEK